MNDAFSEGLEILDLANENVELRRALLGVLAALDSPALGRGNRMDIATAHARAVLLKYGALDPRAG